MGGVDNSIHVPDHHALAGYGILIIVENLPVPFDRRVWLTARTLAAAGARVSIICPANNAYPVGHHLLEGIDIYRHPMPPERAGVLGYLVEYCAALFWQFFLTLRVWAKGGLHAIHACNPPDLIFLVAAPFRLLGVRFLFDQHDLNPELFEAKFNRRGGWWGALHVVERLTFALASVSLAPNESYRAVAIERGKMARERVFTVRSGPDPVVLTPVPPHEKWKDGKRYLVGYVGVMGEQEGLDLLIETIAYLVHQEGRRDIQFVLVGGGVSLARVEKDLAERELGAWVTCTGRVADAVLLEVLSSADICVAPDRFNAMNDKSTMNKVLEYMALGRPIVQYELAEGRVSAGDASLYARRNDPIDFANKISDLLANPDLRARMGLCGQERVRRQLSWHYSVPPLLAAYHCLFEGKRRLAKGKHHSSALP